FKCEISKGANNIIANIGTMDAMNSADVGDHNLTEVLGPEYPGHMWTMGFGISPTLYKGVKHGGVIVQSLQEEVRVLREELVVCKEVNEKVSSLEAKMTKLMRCHTKSKTVNCILYWLSPSNIVTTGAPLGDGISKTSSLAFLVVLIISLVMGIVLNYKMFLCTIINFALTTTIVGVLKGVGSMTNNISFLTFLTLGFVLLGGVQVHALNLIGLIINTACGLWYSYAKFQQRGSKQRKVLSDAEAHHKHK
ncbi:hypothetical protein GIB67_026492, partial [Kingdonia uniflora]